MLEIDPAQATSLGVDTGAHAGLRRRLDDRSPDGVATIGNWRNTPYGVIQNVGSWLDVPQLLDGNQPV
ncbi:MAG: DUF885 domain-containing protein, partial [Sphingomonas sp.]